MPEYDGRILFEKHILDGLQASLSWITILRKRGISSFAGSCGPFSLRVRQRRIAQRLPPGPRPGAPDVKLGSIFVRLRPRKVTKTP